jgi:hypothetical protein
VNITGVMVLECHTKETQDRIRGSKGSKVLRTRKVKVEVIGIVRPSSWNWFCSHQLPTRFLE